MEKFPQGLVPFGVVQPHVIFPEEDGFVEIMKRLIEVVLHKRHIREDSYPIKGAVDDEIVRLLR